MAHNIYHNESTDPTENIFAYGGNIIDAQTGQRTAVASPRQAINSSVLQPAPNIQFSTPQPTPIAPVPSSSYFTTELIPTPKETEASELSRRIRELYGQTVGESAFRVEKEKEADVEGLFKTQQDLSSRLKVLEAEAKSIPDQMQLQAEGRGITASGLAPLTASELRKKSIEANTVGALLAASQGKLTTALTLVDRAVAQKYDPIKEEINASLKNLELLLKDPTLTLAEKNRAQEQLDIQNARKERLEIEKKNQENIFKVATDAASNGAPATVLQAIQEAKTPNEALIAAQDYLVPLKTKADLAESISGTGYDPTEIMAFAQQYATTGQIPVGIPKKSFGVISQVAKSIPKPQGTLINAFTGTRPINVSDKFQDGIAALYDISQKQNELKQLIDQSRMSAITRSERLPELRIRFNSLRKEIVDLLARARTGAALTLNEEQFYTSLLPDFAPGGKSLLGGDRSLTKLDQFRKNIEGSLNNKLRINNLEIVGYNQPVPDLSKYDQ